MDIDGLAKIAAKDEEGVVVTIYQSDGEPYKASDDTPATVTVVGTESKRYRDAKLAHQRKLFKRARAGGREMTPEEANLDAQKLTAAAVIEWHGWEDGGKALPCTPENVLKILKWSHIYDQVQSGIAGHAVFFTADSGD